MAVFVPAVGTNFNFDSLLHQAVDAQHNNDNLNDYEITPISVSNIPNSMSPISPLGLPLPTIATKPASVQLINLASVMKQVKIIDNDTSVAIVFI